MLVLILAILLQAAALPKDGTAVIRGRITDSESGHPIAGALVMMTRVNDQNRRSARTGADGRYEIAGLPAGEYFGSAAPRGHGATHLEEPLRERGTWRMPIVLKDGDVRENLDAALPRARAIGVRVTDEWGGPLAGLHVHLIGAGTGRDSWASARRTTDDRGFLRAFGLSAGKYVICVDPSMVGLPPSQNSPRRERFLRTCYPSALNEADAEVIALDRSDIDTLEIQMRRGRTFSISGTVIDASGAPAPGAMAILNRFTLSGSSGTSISLDAGGRFTVSDVAAGDYAITAEMGGPHRPEHRRGLERAYRDIHVAADVEGLMLTMAKTVTVHGRFVREDSEVSFVLLAGTRLYVKAPLVTSAGVSRGGFTTTSAEKDDTFRLEGVHGPRILEISNLPRGWYVKSVRHKEKEIFDVPTAFDEDSPVEVVLSARGATVTGRVLGDKGEPVHGARVLMYPVGADLWGGHRLSSATTAAAGRFTLGPQKAGDYAVVAVLPQSEPDRRDRARLARLAELGERISLGEHEERTLDLRITKPPQ